MPYSDVQYLANNATFNDVENNPDTVPSGMSLSLNQIGTNTSNLHYVFPGGFTIASGASVSVASNVSVLIRAARRSRTAGRSASPPVIRFRSYGAIPDVCQRQPHGQRTDF